MQMNIGTDETILFEDEHYKFRHKLSDNGNSWLIPVVVLIIAIPVALVSLSLGTLGLIIFAIAVLPIVIAGSMLISLFKRDGHYVVSLDEAAHYLIIRHEIPNPIGNARRFQYIDLTDVSRFEIEERSGNTLLHLVRKSEDRAIIEVPSLDVANYIYKSARSLINSDMPPDEYKRQQYDKMQPFMGVLSNDKRKNT